MSIIQVERNAWRRVHADDAGVLVDAAAYYHAVCWAISRAQSHVLMSGWQFDSGVPLLKMCRPAPTYAFEVPRRPVPATARPQSAPRRISAKDHTRTRTRHTFGQLWIH
jgi:hypothetical protein